MKNLKKLHEERHLSQKNFAEKFNLSQQSIHKYENNQAEPDIKTLIKMASFFHTSVDYLIGNTENPKPFVESEQPLTPTELHLLYTYHQLAPNTQEHILAIMEELIKNM